MLNFKLFLFFVGVCVASSTFAQRTEVDLEHGESAMQISLQKEIYGVLLSDTNEVHAEYKKEGLFYKNNNLLKYQTMLEEISRDDASSVVPELYFTKRTELGIAAMYPNGLLVLNEEDVSRIEGPEAVYLVAHEYAHFKFNHSKQRMKVIAKAVVDNAVMLREPEQALGIAMMLPEVKAAHYAYENEADAYSFKYISKKGIQIDCMTMFMRMANGAAINHDKHDAIEKRCASYEN